MVLNLTINLFLEHLHLLRLLAHFLLIFSPSVSKSLPSFLSKNSFSSGNLYFFVFCSFWPFGWVWLLWSFWGVCSFWPFGWVWLLWSFWGVCSFWSFGWVWFAFGPFEEFVPFGLLDEFDCFGPFEEFVPFGLLDEFGSLLVLLDEFDLLLAFWMSLIALVLLRSLFLLVFWMKFDPFGLLCLSFLPLPSSVFSTSHAAADYW